MSLVEISEAGGKARPVHDLHGGQLVSCFDQPMPLDHPFRVDSDVSAEEPLQSPSADLEALDQVLDTPDAAVGHDRVHDLCNQVDGRTPLWSP